MPTAHVEESWHTSEFYSNKVHTMILYISLQIVLFKQSKKGNNRVIMIGVLCGSSFRMMGML